MQEKNQGTGRQDEHTGRQHGPQGVDKAPGEESSQDNVQFTQQTQKGKKVDRDPAQEQDEPLNEQEV
jgi:hypothetical protein